MNRDDPFAEPFDTDKTVIRPNPAGRRPAVAPASTSVSTSTDVQDVPVGAGLTGLNPLNAAASTLFSLVARIRNRAQHSDPTALRDSVVAEIRTFENAALQAGVPAQTVVAARYAICATIDDVVLNTPWGGQSVWALQSMVGTFHKETHGGDRFYELLSRFEAAPSKNRDMLEFLYVCLSLGFEGRLRVAQRGAEKHLEIRDGLARLIRTHRGPVEPDLSIRWRGADIAHRMLSAWTPVWTTAGMTLVMTCLIFFGFSFALGGDTNRLSGLITALDVNGPVELSRPAPPPPPAPPAPQEISTVEAVSSFLAPEIAQGLLSVASSGNTLTIRIAGNGMFPSGSDQLEPRFGDIMDRVSKALNDEEGRIIVAGHSDNVPIKSARFASNLQLSLSRAQSVMARISGTLTDKGRISSEGRADKEPLASNDTAEGRATNRRIEVILVKAG
jgi:type VI secretion system protein ImpK